MSKESSIIQQINEGANSFLEGITSEEAVSPAVLVSRCMTPDPLVEAAVRMVAGATGGLTLENNKKQQSQP